MDVLQGPFDGPGEHIACGPNGAVNYFYSPKFPSSIIKTHLQRRLAAEAELLATCRHACIMQVYAIVLPEGSTKPNPDEQGHMVVEKLGRSLASYYGSAGFRLASVLLIVCLHACRNQQPIQCSKIAE